MQTISSLLKHGISQLQNFSSSPQLDAEILLSELLKKPKTYLYTYPEIQLTSDNIFAFNKLLNRRLNGEPIAYILGKQEFWNLELGVTPATLIPRPETELLIELALKKLPAEKQLNIADLGTGSGAIALALAAERSHWRIDATDHSIAALEIAKQNAKKLSLANINFFLGDWCHALPQQKYHLIISNPPYIAENDPHLQTLAFEPKDALISGTEGLDALTCIIKQAKHFLLAKGFLCLEHGYDQVQKVKNLFVNEGYQQVVSYQDLAGHYRVTTAYWAL